MRRVPHRLPPRAGPLLRAIQPRASPAGDVLARQEQGRLRRVLRQLNATALILETSHCEVDLAYVLDTRRFDIDKARPTGRARVQRNTYVSRDEVWSTAQSSGLAVWVADAARTCRPRRRHRLPRRQAGSRACGRRRRTPPRRSSAWGAGGGAGGCVQQAARQPAQCAAGPVSSSGPARPTVPPSLAPRYGITSFVFRARRPFHPGRLYHNFLSKYFLTRWAAGVGGSRGGRRWGWEAMLCSRSGGVPATFPVRAVLPALARCSMSLTPFATIPPKSRSVTVPAPGGGEESDEEEDGGSGSGSQDDSSEGSGSGDGEDGSGAAACPLGGGPKETLAGYEAKRRACIEAARRDLGGIVRSKGFAWVATQVRCRAARPWAARWTGGTRVAAKLPHSAAQPSSPAPCPRPLPPPSPPTPSTT